MYHKKAIEILLSVSMLWSSCQAAQRVHGDGQNPDATFSFPIGLCATASNAGLFFATSAQDSSGSAYTLALAQRSENKFIPLAPVQVILDKKEKQPNPFHGSGIHFFAFNPETLLPALVTYKEPKKAYLLKSYALSNDLKSDFSDQLKKDPTLVEVNSFKVDDPIVGLALTDRGICVATAPETGTFGDSGSALVALNVLREAENQLAQQNSNQNNKKNIPDRYEKIITQLDVNSPAVYIGDKAQAFLNHETKLHWSSPIARLYIPLQVQTNSNNSSGARGIVLGYFNDNNSNNNSNNNDNGSSLEIYPIAPDTAFDENSLLGAVGANKIVSVVEVQTMKTSTLLDYLVVALNDGSQLYSFPVVTHLPIKPLKDDAKQESSILAKQGTLAACDQYPVTFHDPVTGLLRSRHFLKTAQKPADIYSAQDKQALIGGGALPAPLSQLTVLGDTVFASTKFKGDYESAGLFYSQAIFDVHGRIASWTPWRRAGGSSGAILGFGVDPVAAGFWYVKNNNTVWRTQWDKVEEQKKSSISRFFTQAFTDVPSGIQNLAAYSPDCPSFSHNLGERLSLVVATGYQAVALAETGKDIQNIFTPQSSFDAVFKNSNGSLTGFTPGYNALVIEGGALNKLGALCASTFATNGKEGWLVVAGSKGVGVLATEDGHGWKVSRGGGLASGFRGLSQNMRFIKFGSYESVYKLLAYQDRLFMITPFAIYVLQLSPDAIKHSHKNSSFIALEKLGDQYKHALITDALIKDGNMLIGTSSGLIIVNIARQLKDPQPENMRTIKLPYSTGSQVRFYQVSSGQKDGLSNIYILDGSPSRDQARVYRLAWEKNSVGLLPDWYSTGYATPSYWCNLATYRGFMATDGSTFLLTGSAFGHQKPTVEVVSGPFYSGDTNFAYRAHVFAYAPHGKSIGQVVRDYGSGAWLAWGDFGVIANT